MPLLLSFGGAFLLGLCFLAPPARSFAMNATAGHWVIAGFLLQIGLEYLSKGMEHGHVHGNPFGLLAFLSLCLHALIEAMPFGLDTAQLAHDHAHDHAHAGHHHHHFGEGQLALLAGIACTNCLWPWPWPPSLRPPSPSVLARGFGSCFLQPPLCLECSSQAPCRKSLPSLVH